MYGACAPLYFRLPEDGPLAPKLVGAFKTYVGFVTITCICWYSIYDSLVTVYMHSSSGNLK
jgi:hypothetical protein